MAAVGTARGAVGPPPSKLNGRTTGVAPSVGLESVRKHQAGLQSFRSMRRIEASRRNASALRLRFSQFLGKPSAAVEPSKGAFDDPTAWKHHESFRPIGALDDFSFELRQDLRQGILKVRPLVATIGKELFQERVHPEKGCKKQDAAIAILDIGRMNDGVQQQTQRVHENMGDGSGRAQ